MKYTLYVLLIVAPLFLGANSYAQEDKIHWVSFEEMQEQMKTNPKKVLIDVYTSWCGPCKMMMRNTFSNQKLVAYINKNYYAVKFNAEGNDTVTFKGKTFTNPNYDPAKAKTRNGTHDLTRAIAPVNGKIAYPTTLYLDEKLTLLTPVQGYLKPEVIEPILHWFGSNTYLKQKYEEYIKTFKSELAN
jgi:thioredoxin-related protein